MTTIFFTDTNGKEHKLKAEDGTTLMELARNNSIDGIEAACGGVQSCGTCAIQPDADWQHLLDGKDAEETDMLDFSVEEPEKCRLSCQVTIDASLDGLKIRIPALV